MTETNRTAAEIREIIKTWAAKKGLRYRIRGTGNVDFYGELPGARGQTGWWFGGYDSEVAQQIVDGTRLILTLERPMTTELVQGEGYLQAIRNGRYTDVGVNTRKGWVVYKREGLVHEDRIADKITHLIGKRIVARPTNDRQITEADLVTAIEEIAE